MAAHAHPKIMHPAQAIGTCLRTWVITHPKVKETQEKNERREDRKAREDRKSAYFTYPPKPPNKESTTLLLSSPPDSPSAIAEAEGILKAKLNEGACVPQLSGQKQMFS